MLFHNRVEADVVLDLVRARGRPGAGVFRLGHLGHRSRRPECIKTSQSPDLAEKVLVPDMLKCKPCCGKRSLHSGKQRLYRQT
jgi:hypothetical protein